MGRKKKYPEYDANRIRQEYMQAVLDVYQSGSRDGKVASLRCVADEFDTTILKVRKVLITVGAYSTEISEEVHDLQGQGKSIAEMQQITGLSRASVQSYLPYSRTIYNAAELSVDAKKCLLYRQRKQAVMNYKRCLVNGLEKNWISEYKIKCGKY